MKILAGACLFMLCPLSLPAISLEEVETGEVASFQHAGTPSEIVCHPDGVHVLSSSRDQCVRLWEIKTGKLIRRFTVQGCGDMWGIRFLNEGKELLAASSSDNVYRFEVATGKVLTTYKHSDTAYRIALHPNGKWFVGTDSENKAILWEIATGKKIRTFEGHTSDVYTAIVVAQGKTLITGSEDKSLKQWDIESGDCLETVEGKPAYGDVYTISASPDQSQFAMVSEEGHVRLFDSKTMAEVWKTKLGDEGQVVAWTPDGSIIGSTSDDGHLYLLNSKDGKVIRKIKVPDGSHIPIAFSNDGKTIISGGDNVLHLHGVGTGERIEPSMGFPEDYDHYEQMAVGPGGSRIYLSDGSKWEMRDRTNAGLSKSFNENRGVTAMALSDDGKLIAVGCERGGIKVRDTTDFKVVGSMSDRGQVNALAFLPGGQKLVSAGDGDTASLWLIGSGKRIRSFEGHSDDVLSMALSFDGEQLITVSRDRSVRVWAVSSGEEQAMYLLKENRPADVALLDGGRSLIVSVGSTRVWGRILPKLEVKEEVDEEAVQQFIKDLASEEFLRREEAMKELAKFGKVIIPIVEATESEDPEVRSRLVGVRDVIRGDFAKNGLKEIAELDCNLSSLATDPLGQFWVGKLGSEGASKVVVGLVDQEEEGVKAIQTIETVHGCLRLTFSPDGSHVGTVNADGSYSLFKVNRN